MSDAQKVVEQFDCNYHVGTAVRLLLEHTQGVDKAVPGNPSLEHALAHVVAELRRLNPARDPDIAAHTYAADEDATIRAVVEDLFGTDACRHERSRVNEAVLVIKGLLISAVRNTLEDLTRAD